MKKDIQKFDEQARGGSDEVGHFAKATLSTLQMHLDIAKDLAKK